MVTGVLPSFPPVIAFIFCAHSVRRSLCSLVFGKCDGFAPLAYQVILEPGIGQFREFEPRRVHTRINSLGLFLVHKLT